MIKEWQDGECMKMTKQSRSLFKKKKQEKKSSAQLFPSNISQHSRMTKKKSIKTNKQKTATTTTTPTPHPHK